MKKKRFSVEQIVAVLNRESWDVGKPSGVSAL
jgi:hypothetical protein